MLVLSCSGSHFVSSFDFMVLYVLIFILALFPGPALASGSAFASDSISD